MLMPDSSNNVDVIHSSLKASIGGGRNKDALDDDIAAVSKRILLHKIDFVSASAPYSIQRDSLRAKYISLNPSQSCSSEESKQKSTVLKQNSVMNDTGDGLPLPKVVLYPEEHVKMEWTTSKTRIGAGLVNMGNTCFFNSILQCLTYTAPLVNYLSTNDHRQKCRKKNFCMMCEVQSHIRSALDCPGRALKPHSMLQKLRCIAKHMKWGRQEDAHEFLRFLVDHMQQSCLNGETKLDRYSKETTVVNQIFGGFLRSQVTCAKCSAKSNTFDPFMDLSLDLKGVNSLEDALLKFVKPEILDNDNAYKCPKCKIKVQARKRFTIQKAPNILTIQLNRFDIRSFMSGKINKFIRYPEKIDLRRYMSTKGDPVFYHLYGVTVHSGYSSDHGHYYSYIKSPNKTWYCMNDASVHAVNINSVLNTDAYVLFYARANKPQCSRTAQSPSNNSARNIQQMKGPYSAPLVTSQLNPEKSEVNGLHGKPSSELGTPLKRQSTSTSSFSFSPLNNVPKITPHGTSPSTLPGAHSKISFPILTAQQKKQQLQQQQEIEDGKRIVLQIKHGNSTTMEKSPNGKSKLVEKENGKNSKGFNKLLGLVPYNDDSDSEQENNALRANTNVITDSSNKNSSISKSPTSNNSSVRSVSAIHQTAISSIPLPTNSGDATCDNVNSRHNKKSVSPIKDSMYTKKDKVLSPTKNNLINVRHPHKSDSHSSTTPQKLERSKVNAQGDAIVAEKPTGKSNVVALELNSVVSVSSPSSSTPSSSFSKLNASKSGKWLVQPQDSAPSPRGSCSSNTSVNSTTEWTVESKGSSSNGLKSKPSKFDVNSGVVIKSFNSPPKSSDTKTNINGDKYEHPKHRQSLFKNQEEPTKQLSKYFSLDEKINSSRNINLNPPPVAVSDTQGLLSPSSSQSDEFGKKKHKKKKAKERELGDKNRENNTEDSSSRSDSSSKKKKHKRNKLEKLKKKVKRDRSSSDSDSDYDKRHKYTKYKRKNSDSERNSDNSDDYEWVEKTIDSPLVRKNISSKSKASIQAWNHHIKDDIAYKKDLETSKPNLDWDGKRIPKIASSLFGSSQSLGNDVLTWDGKKNQIDEDIEKDRQEKKRLWSEEYNEELDSGKVKKVKTHKDDNGYGHYNPFQQYNSKFKEQNSRSRNNFSPHYHKQQFNNKFSHQWSQAAHSKQNRFKSF